MTITSNILHFTTCNMAHFGPGRDCSLGLYTNWQLKLCGLAMKCSLHKGWVLGFFCFFRTLRASMQLVSIPEHLHCGTQGGMSSGSFAWSRTELSKPLFQVWRNSWLICVCSPKIVIIFFSEHQGLVIDCEKNTNIFPFRHRREKCLTDTLIPTTLLLAGEETMHNTNVVTIVCVAFRSSDQFLLWIILKAPETF